MAALIVVALFWGNCFGCPQMLLNRSSHGSSHDCCKRNQKPVSKNCDSQGLHNFVKTDPGVAQQAAPVAATVATVHVPAAVTLPVTFTADVPFHAPPDRLSLHSSFRI